MISCTTAQQPVRAALKRSRVVALLGPRQSGTTTLARQFVAAESLNYFDLEDPASLARLTEPLAKNVEVVPLAQLVDAPRVSSINSVNGSSRPTSGPGFIWVPKFAQ